MMVVHHPFFTGSVYPAAYSAGFVAIHPTRRFSERSYFFFTSNANAKTRNFPKACAKHPSSSRTNPMELRNKMMNRDARHSKSRSF